MSGPFSGDIEELLTGIQKINIYEDVTYNIAFHKSFLA